MGNEVILNKDRLRELERYDFSNNAAWKKTAKEKEDWTIWKEYGNITDIYKKTALDVALTIEEYEKYSEEGDCEFGKEFVKKAQEYFAEYMIEDPDSDSPLLQKIYGELWDNKYLEGCKSSGKIKGETMNSIWTTLKSLKCKSKYLFLSKYVKSRCDLNNKESVSKMDFEEDFLIEDADKNEFVSELDKIRGLRTFLESAHRLGNFIPVPVGCNAPRGSLSSSLRDYWDLTLWIIYEYYINNGKDNKIRNIVDGASVRKGENREEKIEKLTERYKAWLDSFENWDNFVRKNYMRAFVNIKEYGKEKYDVNEHYGVPRELWDGHFHAFLEGEALPKNIKQAEQFFERASFCIHERSVDMKEKLLEKIVKEEVI